MPSTVLGPQIRPESGFASLGLHSGTIALALHLADLVANWLCGILDQQAVLLFNESTAGMLQASYWVRPIYEELLYSSSHAYQGSTVEAQRASNGLVKVISSKTGSDGDHVPQTSSSCISPLAVLGKSLSASVLQIWFPAHWAVRVETRLYSLGVTTSEYRAEHTQTHVPNVRCNIKLPGQSIDVEHCENHARKMRTFFTRRLEPKTKSSNAFKWSLRPKRK